MIAVPVKSNMENPEIDERFGRAEKFCLINNKKEFVFIENSAKDLGSGAGGQVVQLLVENGVDKIISPQVGPKAITAIKALNITLYNIGDAKNVKQALEFFDNNKLKIVELNHTGLSRA